jgi:hypothetical protein
MKDGAQTMVTKNFYKPKVEISGVIFGRIVGGLWASDEVRGRIARYATAAGL